MSLGRLRETGYPLCKDDLPFPVSANLVAASPIELAPEVHGAGPTLMSLIRNLFIKAGLFERRKDGRFHPHGLYAHYSTGKERKRLKIRDLSVTGGYLLTRERWSPGQTIVLTLEKRSLFEVSPHSQVRLRARTVRIGEDGVGASFVPAHLDQAVWTKAVTTAAGLTVDGEVVTLFRKAISLAFLLHICPGAESEILHLVTNALNPTGAERVVETVLSAEEWIEARGAVPASDASAALVLRILQEAANAEEHLLRQCWSGVLAVAAGGADENVLLEFATSLLHLHPPQIHILAAACNMALEAGWTTGTPFTQTLTCSARDIRRITHAKNWVPIGGDLNRLYVLGFLEQSDKPLGGHDIEVANITPTLKGMHFFTVCCAQTGLIQRSGTASIESVA